MKHVNLDELWNEPLYVRIEEGEVVIVGPDDVAMAMTPEAAVESAERLMSAALRAKAED
ncbi:MAG: hypothetical protein ACJ798_08280 [Phenylobacterium sp.]